MYSIVQFFDTSISLIPKLWFQAKNVVLWPENVNRSKLRTWLKNGKKTPEKDWVQYEVHVLRNNLSYAQALEEQHKLSGMSATYSSTNNESENTNNDQDDFNHLWSGNISNVNANENFYRKKKSKQKNNSTKNLYGGHCSQNGSGVALRDTNCVGNQKPDGHAQGIFCFQAI